MALFGDWRGLNCESAGLVLDTSRVYYWHSRTHGIKALFGGTHGHISFWDQRWYTVEITDQETLEYQNCEIAHRGTEEYQRRAAFISTRRPDQQWFGNPATVVSTCQDKLTLDQVTQACKLYPIAEFDLVSRNCNTFVSYLIYKLDLNLKRPAIAVGYKSRNYWKKAEWNHVSNTQKIIILNGAGATNGTADQTQMHHTKSTSDIHAAK